MSKKRLQVILEESEYRQIKEIADRESMSVSEWVRQALRRVRRSRPTEGVDRKLELVRAAARHEFPTADIDEMLAEIERGYLGRAD